MSTDITPRQLEILKLLAEGYTSKEIAEELGTAPSTINNLHSDMKARMWSKTTAQLIAKAFREGLLE